MEIRRLTTDDMPQMMAIQKESYSSDLVEAEEESAKFFAWPICHGIVIDNQVVAAIYGYCEGDLFHIYSIESLSEYRNQGLGSKLLKFSIDFAKQSGCNRARAWAISHDGRKILEKFGFEANGIHYISHYTTIAMYLELKD